MREGVRLKTKLCVVCDMCDMLLRSWVRRG